MKEVKYPLALTALLYMCFSIGAQDFDYTTWHTLTASLFATFLALVWGVFIGVSYFYND